MEDVRRFLTGEMEDRVIPDIMLHVFLPQGRYPENFVLIYLLEVCQEGVGVKKWGTWRTLRAEHGDIYRDIVLSAIIEWF